MPINLAGSYGAGGVHDALLEIVKQRMLEQELAQREEENQFQRLRAQQLDARQAEQEKYNRSRDVLGDTRQERLDKLAEEARQQQMGTNRATALKGQPRADINASLGMDPSSVQWKPGPTAPGVPETGLPSYSMTPMLSNRIDLGGGVKIRPQSAEDLDAQAAADEKRKQDEAVALAGRLEGQKPPKYDISNLISKRNGQPVAQDAKTNKFYQGGQEVPASDVAYRPIETSGGSTGPLVQIQGPNGEAIWATREEALHQPTMRPVSGGERQTLSYYNRAKDAHDTAASLDPVIAKMGLMGQTGLQVLPNWAQSAENQAYRQAQRAFTEARLRKESGAAINPTEYENDAKTYFAQPGDKPATIAIKVKKRETLLRGLAFSAGKAYEEFYGQPAPRDTDVKEEIWVRDPKTGALTIK